MRLRPLHSLLLLLAAAALAAATVPDAPPPLWKPLQQPAGYPRPQTAPRPAPKAPKAPKAPSAPRPLPIPPLPPPTSYSPAAPVPRPAPPVSPPAPPGLPAAATVPPKPPAAAPAGPKPPAPAPASPKPPAAAPASPKPPASAPASPMAPAAPYIVPALSRHTATVIFAHGLGDSGSGWLWLPQLWRRQDKLSNVKFVFPNAPTIPVTLNMGFAMPAWYDIRSLSDLQENEDEAGMTRSQQTLQALIDAEAALVGPERVVLGGFSQGGAMALLAGLTYPKKLGGVFGLSCYMPLQRTLQQKVTQAGAANAKTPIFMGHGDQDDTVRYEWGKRTADKLLEWGFGVQFWTYNGLSHSANEQEVGQLEGWLEKILPAA